MVAWSWAWERRGTVGPRASGSTSCTWTQSTSWTRRPCRPSARKHDAGVANGHGESSKGARGKGYGKGTKGHRERGNGSRERGKGTREKGQRAQSPSANMHATEGPFHACWPLPRVLAPCTPFHACSALPRVLAPCAPLLRVASGCPTHRRFSGLPVGRADLAVLGGELDGLQQAQVLVDRAANVVVVDVDVAQDALVVNDERATAPARIQSTRIRVSRECTQPYPPCCFCFSFALVCLLLCCYAVLLFCCSVF